MKKLLLLLFTISTVLLLAACGGSSTGTDEEPLTTDEETNNEESSETVEPVTIRLGHVGAEKSGAHIGSAYFAERVSELTDGKVTVDIYPGAQLGGERDLVESVSGGTLEMAAPGIPVIGNFTNALLGLNMPFLIKNAEVEKELYQSELITVEAFNELEKLNLKGLGFISTGFFQFGISSKPVTNMEDMKGITIRSTENAMMVDAYAAVGLNPTPMPYPEMYSALQTGVIDAGALQIASWISEGMVEVINHISLVNALPYPHFLIVNLEEFNSLPQVYQDALTQAGNETTEYMFEFTKEYDEESLQQLKDMGIPIVEDFDRTGIDEAIQPVIEKYAKEDPLVERTFELIEELNSKY